MALASSIDSDTRQRYRQEKLGDIETHRVEFTTTFPDLAAKKDERGALIGTGIEKKRAASVPL